MWLIAPFAVQKLFRLVQSHLFTFAFVACAFGVYEKNSFSRPRSRSNSEKEQS